MFNNFLRFLPNINSHVLKQEYLRAYIKIYHKPLNPCFECKPKDNFYFENSLAFPLNFPSSEQMGEGRKNYYH